MFLAKEEASQILNRQKRANFGFEEIKEGDLQRECYDEQCNYEEVHEVFEEDTQTVFQRLLTCVVNGETSNDIATVFSEYQLEY